MISWSDYELTKAVWLWLIPAYLLLIFILPLLKNTLLIKDKSADLSKTSGNKLTLYHPLVHLLSSTNIHAIKKNKRPHILYSIIFILLTIALAQPVKIGKRLPDPPKERDITFIVDTSVSMILRDYILNGERIDRMSLLKTVLDKFIQQLKGERMSLIVFGDTAYTLVPMTADQHLLRKMLTRVEATMAGRFNAIGDAVALAVKHAKQEFNNSQSNKRKRILVLLTDADQPTGKIDPAIAAQLAKEQGLPLYTIAIGASNIAADEKRQGGLIYSPVNLNLLTQIASITGANNYQAGSPDALEKAIEAINSHETNTRIIKPIYYRESLYYWFVIIAFTLFTLSQLVSLIPLTLHKRGNSSD